MGSIDIPVFENEADRLEALRRFSVFDTGPEPGFDRIVRLAALLFGAPMASVSLVGETHQFLKAQVGLGGENTPRRESFCAHALAEPELLVVGDARQDLRFARNPLVVGAPFIRFYAGAPLVTGDGHPIGSLCVLDTQPRPPLSTVQEGTLRALAATVMDLLEMRRLRLTKRAALRLAGTTSDAIVCADQDGRITFWNRAAERTFGHPRREAVGKPLDLIVPPRLRESHHAGFGVVSAGGARRLGDGPLEMVGLHRDGNEIPIELSLATWRGETGMQAGAIIRDVSERRRAQERVHDLTHFDRLTGLPNRVSFIEAVAAFVAEGAPFALIKIGLDKFRGVNAALGLSVGDAVLRLTADRLQIFAQAKGGLAARLGADEFGILKPGCGAAETEALATEVLALFDEPYGIQRNVIRLTASAGAVAWQGPDGGREAGAVLESGLLALRHAKTKGSGVELFRPALRQLADSRHRLEKELEIAFARDEFELHYQPQVRLADGGLVGAEALLRWRHPARGLLTPAAFLPTLEASALAPHVGAWALREAARLATGLQRPGQPVRMGVNLFSAQFRAGDLVASVERALAESGLQPQSLEIEITETTILKVDEHVIEPLTRLRERGIGIAFDDYGTGYASLSLLKRYPLTRLKIDREFVRDLESDPDDAAIIRAVLALGSSLGLDVIAEGVETAEQASFLRQLGCGEAQGYLFGRPMPGQALVDLVHDRARGRVQPDKAA